MSGCETDRSGSPTGGLASADFLEGVGTVVSEGLTLQIGELAIVIEILSVSLSFFDSSGSLE